MHIKTILKIAFALFLAYVVWDFGVLSALAADDEKNKVVSVGDSFLKKISDIFASLLLLLYYVFFWPVLKLISVISSNDFIFGEYIGKAINEIWVRVRDLVNIFFVFMLLIVAFANITGIQSLAEKFNLRQTLPKVIIAMILVNFSLFFSKFAIDTVNVLTTVTYAIPTQTQIESAKKELAQNKPFTVLGYNCNFEREFNCDRMYEKCQQGAGTNCQCYKEVCELDRKEGNYHWFEFETVAQASKGKYATPSGDSVTYSSENLYNLERDHVVCHFVVKENDMSATESGDKKTNENILMNVIAARFVGMIKPEEFYNTRTDTKNSEFKTNYEVRTEMCPKEAAKILNKNAYGSTEANTYQTGNTRNLFEFLVNNIFIVVIFVMLFFAFLALLVALIIRTVVLWLLIMVSPAIVVQQILFKGAIGGDPLDMFLKHLLIPLKIAAVFALTFILMQSVGTLLMPSGSVTIRDIFQYVTTGKGNGASLNVLQHILYLVMIASVLWAGVWWSFAGTKAEGITNKIKGAGEWVLKSPQYMPLPIPGIGKISAKGLAGIPGQVKQGLDMKVQEMDGAAYRKMGFSPSVSGNTAKDNKDKPKEYLISMANNRNAINEIKDGGSASDDEVKNHLDTAGFNSKNLSAEQIKKLRKGDVEEWNNLQTKDGEKASRKMQSEIDKMAIALQSGGDKAAAANARFKDADTVKTANEKILKTQDSDKDKDIEKKKEIATLAIANLIYNDKREMDLSDTSKKDVAEANDSVKNLLDNLSDKATEGITDAEERKKAKVKIIEEVLLKVKEKAASDESKNFDNFEKGMETMNNADGTNEVAKNIVDSHIDTKKASAVQASQAAKAESQSENNTK